MHILYPKAVFDKHHGKFSEHSGYNETLGTLISQIDSLSAKCPVSAAFKAAKVSDWFHAQYGMDSLEKPQLDMSRALASAFAMNHGVALKNGRASEAFEVCSRIGPECNERSSLGRILPAIWKKTARVIAVDHGFDQADELIFGTYAFAQEVLLPNRAFMQEVTGLCEARNLLSPGRLVQARSIMLSLKNA